MAWTVEFSDEFADWFRKLTEDEATKAVTSVDLARRTGSVPGRPHVDTAGIPGMPHEGNYGSSTKANHTAFCLRSTTVSPPHLILGRGGKKYGRCDWYKVNIRSGRILSMRIPDDEE